MSIKSKLLILALLPVFLAAIAVAAVLRMNHEGLKSRALDSAAHEITKNIFELRLSISQYLLQAEERPKVQFRITHESLKRNLALFNPRTEEEDSTVKSLSQNHQVMGELFSAFVLLQEKDGAGLKDQDLPELRERIAGQLLAIAGDMAAGALRLSRITAARIDTIYDRGIYSMLLLILCSTLATLVLSYFVGASIFNPVRKLKEWADAVAGGDTHHQVEIETRDEMGILAKAFNALTGKLRDSYVSIKDLHQEIAERRRIEDALGESEKRYRSLFEEMSEGFALHEVICDEKGRPCDYRFLEINPAFERLTGLKRAGLVNRTFNEVLPNEDPKWVKEYGEVALTGKSVHFDNYSPALKRHYEVFAYSPAPRQFGVLFIDITERKHAEEETRKLQQTIQEERDRLTALVNSITDEVWFADTHKKFTLANPSALREFGLDMAGNGIDVEKLVKISEVYRPDGTPRPMDEAPPLLSLQGKVIRNQEESLRTPARGEIRYRQVSSAPVRNTEGDIVGSVSVVRDITELKRMEQELRRSRDELELRVRERTEELARSQDRLQNLSSQLLLAQEKERKRVAIELHDGILSELAGVKYLLEGRTMLLEKGAVPDIDDLKRISNILAAVIRETRGIMTNLHPALLDELGLVAAISWLSGEYEKSYPHIKVQRKIEVVENDIEKSLRVVIYRILQESLNNFVKHAKGNLVDLSLTKSAGPLVFMIRDNGQGFDVEKAEKGLGLDSMKERVELSGGEFHIESVIGQGTTIRAIWSPST